jgi:basic amino acid/polyamine antiporter, APA family
MPTIPIRDPTLIRGLGLIAATSIVIGNVIGTGVFLKSRVMICNVGTPGRVIGVWLVAGLLSLAGALTYAELAAIWPHAGGEYVFIREAYSSRLAFLYGWMRFFVASAGSMAALAVGLAILMNVLLGGVLGVRFFTLNLRGYEINFGGIQVVALSAIAVVNHHQLRLCNAGWSIRFSPDSPQGRYHSCAGYWCAAIRFW